MLLMTISKGEIWLVNLDPTIGDEIQKKRPAVVVNCDALGLLALRVVVPITGWQARFDDCDWLIRLAPDEVNCLDKVSAADTFQVRSISTRRFVRRLGKLYAVDMERVVTGLARVLDL
jgi:mRNA interferase MazF